MAEAAKGAPARVATRTSPASLFIPKSFICLSPGPDLLEGRCAGLTGPNAHGVLDIEDENFAIADLAG